MHKILILLGLIYFFVGCGKSKYLIGNNLPNKSTFPSLINGFQFNKIYKESKNDIQFIYAGNKSLPDKLNKAVQLNWLDYVYLKDDKIKWILKDLSIVESEIKKQGLSKNQPVILFGDSLSSSFFSSGGWGEEGRIAWMLDRLGYSNISIVDGGLNSIERSDKDKIQDPKDRVILKEQDPFKKINLVSFPTLKKAQQNTPKSFVFLDTRTLPEHEGKVSHVPKKGKIPGSLHFHLNELFDSRGKLKPVKNLKIELNKRGIDGSKTIVAYCSGGVRSAMVTYILSNYLKFPAVHNYDGSWAEWSESN